MPIFFFNIRHQKNLICDHEGSDLPDTEAAFLQAFASGQELWTILLADREDPALYSFEVLDEAGRLLFVFPLKEVLETAQGGAAVRPLPELGATLELLSRTQALRASLSEELAVTRRNLATAHGALEQLTRIGHEHTIEVARANEHVGRTVRCIDREP